MNLEQQVTSLALSKRLKGLGVKQVALFWWSEHTIPATLWNEHDLGENDPYAGVSDESVAAFTVAELGQLLYGEETPHSKGGGGYWETSEYYDLVDGRHRITADTEAEARGLMLAHLIENKLLSV